jgi:hypothetical protein
LTCSSYDEIMKLDAEARELRDKISPHLKMRSMDESARDPSTMIMQRFTLDLLYLKIICILHRKFLAYARVHARFSYSRTAVIDASMNLLQHQATLHRECQPGGRLRNVKWFISSLTTVDFLLAAMIIASDLYHTMRTSRQARPSEAQMYLWSSERIDEMVDAMETAVNIWEGLKDHSMEAYKAHTTLSVMLNQLKKDRPSRHPQMNGFQAATSAYPAPSPMDESNVAPEHSAAMTLGMLSTGGMAPNSANMFDQRYPTSMANLLNDPVPQPSTGLTPNYNGATSGTGPENAPSPFSNLFGANLFQNLDLPPTDNLNWVRVSNLVFWTSRLTIFRTHGIITSRVRTQASTQRTTSSQWILEQCQCKPIRQDYRQKYQIHSQVRAVLYSKGDPVPSDRMSSWV